MMLVERAAEKPSMLKLISVAVQRARPAMTGKRDRFTHSPGDSKTNSARMNDGGMTPFATKNIVTQPV